MVDAANERDENTSSSSSNDRTMEDPALQDIIGEIKR